MRFDDSPQLVALRQQLDRIDREVPLPTHPAMIERLLPTYPHSITLVERSNGNWGPQAYNCLMYALDLRDLSEAVLNLEAMVQQLNIDSAFARDLVTGGLEEIPDGQAGEGDVAIYFRNDVPVHAALVVQNALVRSKWGPTGHLWQHGIFEVLSDYGDEVRFFRRLPRDQIVARFTSHVERLIEGRKREVNGH